MNIEGNKIQLIILMLSSDYANGLISLGIVYA